MKRQARLAAAIWWCASAAWAVDWTALKPQGYVSDFAGVVDASSKSQLDSYCAAVERATGARIDLVTISSLQNEPIEDVAHTLFRAWDLDRRPPSNGVMWLVAIDDRRDYVETARGLAAVLTESEIAAILREARPALARRQYAQALMAAADEIGTRIAAARHKRIAERLPLRAHQSWADSIPWLLAAGALLVCAWLFHILRRPSRKIPVAGGFGSDEV